MGHAPTIRMQIYAFGCVCSESLVSHVLTELSYVTKKCGGMSVKFNSWIEGLTERGFEGMEAGPTVGGNSVEGQSPSWPVQVHPRPTGTRAEGRNTGAHIVMPHKTTFIRANQTPRLVVASQLAIIHITFPANASVR